MKNILQDWVSKLGIRHQGTLLGAVRGCDTAVKDDPSKKLTRFFRGVVLNPHVGDPTKAKSFIEWCETEEEFNKAVDGFFSVYDALPHHFVMHFIHAAEIVGYYYPDPVIRSWWYFLYAKAIRKLHLVPESLKQLDMRLNASEDIFSQEQ